MRETNNKRMTGGDDGSGKQITRVFSFTHSSCETRLVSLATVLFCLFVEISAVDSPQCLNLTFFSLNQFKVVLLAKNQTQ